MDRTIEATDRQDELEAIRARLAAVESELAAETAARLRAEERQRHQAERETILHEVAASLTLGLNRDELLGRILTQLDRVIASRSAGIMLIDGDTLSVTAQRGSPGTPEQFALMLAARPRSIWSVLETAQPRIINDAHHSPDFVLGDEHRYIQSWLGIPLLAQGQCIGIMTIDRDRPNAFSERDRDLAMTFAHQAAVAIDNARLFAREQAHADELKRHVRERTRELEVLYGITATAVGNPNLESLTRRSLELTADAFGCAAAAIHLIEGETNQLKLSAVFETRADLVGVWAAIPADHPLLLRSLELGAPSISRDPNLLTDRPGRTFVLVTVPLRSRGRDLGVLSLLGESSEPFADDGLPLLMTIANQIGAAVENIKLRQLIHQAAIIEERERLARDIHDQVTQTIYAVGLFAEAARGSAAAGNLEKVRQHTQTILRLTNLGLRELRLLLFELRTEALARNGLVDALRERFRTVEQRAGIVAHVHTRDVGDLPVAVEETFYRIALEALNNALRHARAGRVDIILDTQDGEFVMTIADDGIGLNLEAAAQSGGIGLESMQKRIGKVGGSLSLHARPGNGTLVTVRAPLNRPAPAVEPALGSLT